ncbi:hypothetical protein Tco_0611392 [Tanacetum coccineum]
MYTASPSGSLLSNNVANPKRWLLEKDSDTGNFSFSVVLAGSSRIARDVFVLVGKFTFPADFVIVDYESDPRYSNEPHQESINIIDVYNVSHEEIREDLFATNHPSGNPTSSLTSHTNLASLEVNDDIFDPEEDLFLDEHALDYSSPLLWDDYEDEPFDHEIVNDDTYDDPFDFKEEKIKDSKILIDELDLPESNNVLPFLECDSVFMQDFLRSPNFVTPEKNVKMEHNALNS